MGRKSKFSFETKIDIVKRCLKGETTANHEAMILGINKSRVLEWIALYQSLGNSGLISSSKNTHYTQLTKKNAVLDYLNGKGSYSDICKKYKIRSSTQLRNWIKKYNGHEKLKTSGTGGYTSMTKGRKTTYEERIEIVEYCIEQQNNYAETAEMFQVSYQQVYTWVKKHKISGVDGLLDQRGRTKPVEEMSELERLQAENRLLKAENNRQKMEMDFLKKLEEVGRRRD